MARLRLDPRQISPSSYLPGQAAGLRSCPPWQWGALFRDHLVPRGEPTSLDLPHLLCAGDGG